MTIDTSIAADVPQAVPQGFEPHFRKSPLTDPWEPLYSKKTDRGVSIGLRLAKPHTNSRGLIHGGLIAALADGALGYSCAQATGWTTSFVTISLAVDFVGSAKIGQWLAVEGDVIKTGSTICFAQCLIKADDVTIARASGTFRVVPKKEPVS
ncbi:PaaI family thioesterase [Bradyrhizobium genosp. P]|uniref:PaaI family thioesterase n=1 Tax=Bradyrhizobium genosp. P TaxID=83641 RepID=UPI003CF8D900